MEFQAFGNVIALLQIFFFQNIPSRVIESLHEVYYCPLKANRQVDDSGGQRAYQHIDNLSWDEDEI